MRHTAIFLSKKDQRSDRVMIDDFMSKKWSAASDRRAFRFPFPARAIKAVSISKSSTMTKRREAGAP
jgi:hypothetical protein